MRKSQSSIKNQQKLGTNMKKPPEKKKKNIHRLEATCKFSGLEAVFHHLTSNNISAALKELHRAGPFDRPGAQRKARRGRGGVHENIQENAYYLLPQGLTVKPFLVGFPTKKD